MKRIIAALMTVAVLSSCGSDPTTRIADAVEQQGAEWSDRNDPPDYPASATAMRNAWLAFDALTSSERRELCSEFWSMSDDEIYNDWAAEGFSDDEINGVLNVMWAHC